MLQREGSVLWEQPNESEPLDAKTRLRTGDQSSAVVHFSEGSYLKLPPYTTIIIDRLPESGGKYSNLAIVESGKIWAVMKSDAQTERFIIETPGGIVEAKEGSLFVEADPGGKSACVDVFSGSANTRSYVDPQKTGAVESNKRSILKADAPPPEPAGISSTFDTDNDKYSCLEDASKKSDVVSGSTVVTVKEDADGKLTMNIKSTATTVFQSAQTGGKQEGPIIEVTKQNEGEFITFSIKAVTTATFTKCAQDGAECIYNDDCCGGLCNKNVCQSEKLSDNFTQCIEDGFACKANNDCCSATCINKVCAASAGGEEKVYGTVIVVKTVSATFTDTKCETAPVVELKSFNGQTVAEGENVVVAGPECETSTKVPLVISTAPKCGYLSSLTFKAGKESANLGSVAENQTGSFTANLTLSGTEQIPIEITGKDSFNNTTTVKFNAQLQRHESLMTPPAISSVNVGGKVISEGDTAEVAGAECAASAKTPVTWTVTPRCGTSTLSSVNFKSASTSKSWSPRTTGASNFSSSITLSGTDPVPAEISATDSLGNSSTFKFSAALRQNENMASQPTVQTVLLDGQPVSQGDKKEINITSCNQKSFKLSGKARSACGQISSVTVSKDGSRQTVSGTADWESIISLSSAGGQSSFEIKAKNSLGAESEPFTFEVNVEKDINPPTVTTDRIGTYYIEDTSAPAKIYKGSLESGKLVVRGSAQSQSCTLAKVEVSLDDGGSWNAAQGTTSWSYGFSPSERTYYLRARAADSTGTVSEEADRAVEFTYYNRTPEDELLDVFKRLIQAYINKSTSSFLQLTSSNYSSNYDGIQDYNALDESLDNKFIANPTIYLRYQVIGTPIITGDMGQVSFQWSSDQSGSGYNQSAIFSFIREDEGWLFSTVRDDNTFLRYTSVAATITLTPDSLEIVADDVNTMTIKAEVRDSARNLIKDGTEVRFSVSPYGTITPSATTRNGIAEATFTAGNQYGNTAVSATSGAAVAIPVTIRLIEEHAPPTPYRK